MNFPLVKYVNFFVIFKHRVHHINLKRNATKYDVQNILVYPFDLKTDENLKN